MKRILLFAFSLFVLLVSVYSCLVRGKGSDRVWFATDRMTVTAEAQTFSIDAHTAGFNLGPIYTIEDNGTERLAKDYSSESGKWTGDWFDVHIGMSDEKTLVVTLSHNDSGKERSIKIEVSHGNTFDELVVTQLAD